jgi:hypothetical protein
MDNNMQLQIRGRKTQPKKQPTTNVYKKIHAVYKLNGLVGGWYM